MVASDVDLDVTMTSPGSYSATISTGIEGGAAAIGANATVTVTTPMFNVSVGTDDAAGGAGGGADASDLYADIDHMTGIGTEKIHLTGIFLYQILVDGQLLLLVKKT